MKCLTAILIAVVVFTATPSRGQEAAQSIDSFKWLAGCWAFENKDRGLSITEIWMKPEGETMLGVGRTVKNGKTIDFEFLRIVKEADGISYVSKPTGNMAETSFKLIKSMTGEIVFENAAHDFPQRILYRQPRPDMLSARIEGTQQGKARGVDFPYVRAKCE